MWRAWQTEATITASRLAIQRVIFTGGLPVVPPRSMQTERCHVAAGLDKKRSPGVRDGLGCDG
jgi:hypothetical protein